MKQIDLDQANIDNLTQLWKLMGVTAVKVSEACTLYSSKYWPNRLWYDWVCQPEENGIQVLIQKNHDSSRGYCIPTWGGRSDKLSDALEANAFTCLFKQTAMALDLNNYEPVTQHKLNVTRVQSVKDCQIWTDIAALSFGYSIDSAVIKNIVDIDELQLVMAFYDGTPVATGMLCHTREVIGIHQVGVLPTYRSKGIARQLMHYLLNDCKASGRHYATLQASNLGETLYRDLGFVDQFEITNYIAIP